MSGNQQIHISKDANGNVFISGDGNIVIVQATRTIEPQQPAISPAIGPNPYKGLSAFLEEDAERFFGREKLVRELWKRFRSLHEDSFSSPPLVGGVRGGGSSLRLLAILGPSGSGKSSVVRAGLIPELARRPLPGMRRARVAVVIPGNDPIGALAITLARIATNDPSPAAKSREFAAEIRRRNAEGECDGLLWIARNLPDIEIAPLIVLIDQFEEVYAPPKKKAIKEQKKAIKERQQFIDNLLHAAADPSKYVSVIITLRSDFLGQTQSHPAFNQAIARHGEIIPVMDEAELRAAIVKPAENAGHALDNACTDLLIEQTRDREGALPLLQFALERIWDGLAEGVAPADTLKRIGGVGGALAGEAQRLYEKLPDKDKPIARRAFLALVQLGEGTRDTRRRISLTKIVAHGEEPAHVQAVIRCFADPRTRLVTLSATPDGAETAEVTHEALLEHWDTLREWLDDNREDLRFHRHLDQDADYWEKQGKPDGKLWRPPDLDLLRQYHQRAGQDMTPLQVEFFQTSERKERHSKRIRRIAVTALVVLTVIAMGAAGVALWAYNQVNEQKAEVERQLRISTARSLILTANQHTQDGKRELAALLVRQAYFLNQQNKEPEDVNKQIDSALRKILLTKDGTTDELIDQICHKVSRNLTQDEWQQVVSSDIFYTSCPDLPDYQGTARFTLRLRSTPMTTMDIQDLSLNVLVTGYPATNIDNDFEDKGEVIVAHATGLMWQKSGSPEYMIYEDAKKYIQQLNQQKFAGYADWRLPTIEELVSLLEPEQNEQGLYIDPIFDDTQRWCWSADLRQIKDEGSAESAWYVNFINGLVDWYSLNVNHYVRAVRS